MAIKYANYLKGNNDTNISFIPPQPTESMRGGIIAKAKTDESVEVAVDSVTGKAFVPAYPDSMNASQIVEDDDHKFVTAEEKSAWSGGTLYNNSEPTVEKLGGIPAGTTFEDMTVTDVLTKLLYPYIGPVVTVSSTPNGGTYEKGTTQNVSKVTVNVTKKSDPIKKVEVFHGTESLGSITDGSTGALSFDVDVDITDASTVKKLTVKVTDASAETDSTKVVSKDTTAFSFVYPYYRGVLDADTEITEDVIEGLTKEVVAKGNKTYTYTAANQMMVIAFPKSHGTLKEILDPNSFNVTDTWTCEEVSTTALDGTTVVYYVYTSKLVTVEEYKMKFNY